MLIPQIAERVRVTGYAMPFFVTSIDDDLQVVNLIPVAGWSPVLNQVPFSLLSRGPSIDSEPNES